MLQDLSKYKHSLFQVGAFSRLYVRICVYVFEELILEQCVPFLMRNPKFYRNRKVVFECKKKQKNKTSVSLMYTFTKLSTAFHV